MPYIKEERRGSLDDKIDALILQLKLLGCSAGDTNYTITRIVVKAQACPGNGAQTATYERINRAIGVLECVKQELYRRVAAPYEDKKKEENGDVY